MHLASFIHQVHQSTQQSTEHSRYSGSPTVWQAVNANNPQAGKSSVSTAQSRWTRGILNAAASAAGSAGATAVNARAGADRYATQHQHQHQQQQSHWKQQRDGVVTRESVQSKVSGHRRASKGRGKLLAGTHLTSLQLFRPQCRNDAKLLCHVKPDVASTPCSM
jgi:hypothetical protein